MKRGRWFMVWSVGLVCLAALSACSVLPQVVVEPESTPTPGRITPPAPAATGAQDRWLSSPAVSYWLYVPTQYDARKDYPLLVVFPHRGIDRPEELAAMAETRDSVLVVMADGSGTNDAAFASTPPAGSPLEAGLWDGAPPFQRNLDDHQPRMGILQADPSLLQAVQGVLAVVEREYRIDPERRYLLGWLDGGGSVLYVAGGYPDLWAGMAVSDYAVDASSYPFVSIQNVPAFFLYGEARQAVPRDAFDQMVSGLRAKGGSATVLSVPGGEPDTTWKLALAQIFDFFDGHTR